MSEFITRIEDAILRHRLLQKGDAVLVAVSGGLDSMVLLHALHSLSSAHRWKLAVAHFNHLLRGPESNADERFVARAAKRMGLPFRAARSDVMKLAGEKGLSIEMAARALRHEFLARTAAELGYDKVALAHHADDQVELFFIRLFRGAGTQGLGGMGWGSPSPASDDIALLRPLLGETKTSLADYARKTKIRFREDASNLSPDILRNRIRHKLLPLLNRDYQPGIGATVLRSMELIHDDGEFVTTEALRWLQAKREASSFAGLHTALQRRVLQLELLDAGIVPQFEHIEWLRTHPGQWITIRPGLRCRRGGAGEIEKQVVSLSSFAPEELDVALGTAAGATVFGSTKFRWSFVSGDRLPRGPKTNLERFDAALIGPKILLRHWRAGDRFQPIGMKRAVKLQDLFVNQKVPRAQRHLLTVAATASGEIFWVEGLRIGERFKVTDATQRMLVWRWKTQPS